MNDEESPEKPPEESPEEKAEQLRQILDQPKEVLVPLVPENPKKERLEVPLALEPLVPSAPERFVQRERVSFPRRERSCVLQRLVSPVDFA